MKTAIILFSISLLSIPAAASKGSLISATERDIVMKTPGENGTLFLNGFDVVEVLKRVELTVAASAELKVSDGSLSSR
jgi:hypothetical protein